MKNTIAILFAIFVCTWTSCVNSDSSEMNTNQKAYEAAKLALDSAGNSEQVNHDLLFGFKSGMNFLTVSQRLDSLEKVGIVKNIIGNSFDLKIPGYKSLTAKVDLQFHRDELCRMAFQIDEDYSAEDWLMFTESFFKSTPGDLYDYFIPYEGLGKDDCDDYTVFIDKNIVVTKKKVKYGSILGDETVYIYENYPVSKEIGEYRTQKEIAAGENRHEEIKKTKIEVERHLKDKEENTEIKAKENVYNNSWDGSVRQVTKYLQENLSDPKSYEGIDWSEVQKLEGIYIVRHKYRAKNSFGVYVIQNQIFKLDINGNVVDNYSAE